MGAGGGTEHRLPMLFEMHVEEQLRNRSSLWLEHTLTEWDCGTVLMSCLFKMSQIKFLICC